MTKQSRQKIKYTDEALSAAVSTSCSVAESLFKLIGRHPSSGIYKTFYKRVQQAGIDTSHFTGMAYLKSKKRKSIPKGNEHGAWKGYGEISSELFHSYEVGAQRRNLEFNISIETIWELFLEQRRCCALTGWELSFAPSSERKSEGTASLDRIDSSKGYIIGNIQWTHKDVNLLKNRFAQSYFLEICEAVSQHRTFP